MDNIINELWMFGENAYNLRQPTFLFFITVFVVGIILFLWSLWDTATESFDNAFYAVRNTFSVLWMTICFIISYNNFCTSNMAPQQRPLHIQLEPLNHFVNIDLFGVGVVGAVGGGHPQEAGPNDTQNVHDTTVQAHIIEAVNKLKNRVPTPQISTTDTVAQIKHYILTEYEGDDTVKENALYSIKKINKYNGIIGNLNMNELEVLQLVWNRILDPINKDRAKTLKENLVLQLADVVYNGEEIYCVQGRVTRVIQSLEHADIEEVVTLKPLWAIKEEIANFFPRYRNNYIAQLSKRAQYLCNECVNPTPKEQLFIDKVNKSISSGIRKRLIIRYVESKLITLKKFQEITDPFFAEFV